MLRRQVQDVEGSLPEKVSRCWVERWQQLTSGPRMTDVSKGSRRCSSS